MAVAQLYHHVAPGNEISIITKPLIRLLKSFSEVQNIVLSNIATLSAARSVSASSVWCMCARMVRGGEGRGRLLMCS